MPQVALWGKGILCKKSAESTNYTTHVWLHRLSSAEIALAHISCGFEDKYKNLQNKKEIKTAIKIASENCHIRDSDIYKLIKTSIDNNTFKIVEQDWDKLQELINEIYRDFDHNLNAFYEVNLQEYRICLLIKIGVTPTNIAHIMNLTKEAITASRRRMYMKAFKTKGTPSDWDNIIRAL